jgi:hypothetical protein
MFEMKIRLSELKRVIAAEVRRSKFSSRSSARQRTRHLVEGSRPDIEQELISCLDDLDRCDADDDFRYPDGHPGSDQPSVSGDRAYGIESDIERLLEELEQSGYSEDEIFDIDPRVSEHYE